VSNAEAGQRRASEHETEPVHGSGHDPATLGDFIREQRQVARLSLRKLSDMAQISNPYLSQIERGLRKPSAEILQQLAKALRISAETLYVQAGILEERRPDDGLEAAIQADPGLTETQKRALSQVYKSFLVENAHENR
jgi:transcriptional regulator with XRE-family HTH domain